MVEHARMVWYPSRCPDGRFCLGFRFGVDKLELRSSNASKGLAPIKFIRAYTDPTPATRHPIPIPPHPRTSPLKLKDGSMRSLVQVPQRPVQQARGIDRPALSPT